MLIIDKVFYTFLYFFDNIQNLNVINNGNIADDPAHRLYNTQFIDLFYGVVNQILSNIQKWVTMNGGSLFYCEVAYKHTI